MEYPVKTPDQLGQVLKGRRKAQQLTQQKAAETVGLLPKTVSRLELAPATATVESLFKLLSALRLEIVVRPKPTEPPPREW